MGNTIYINDGNDKVLNKITTYFFNHENNKIRTKRITPNYIIRFIFNNVVSEEKLVLQIERCLQNEKK